MATFLVSPSMLLYKHILTINIFVTLCNDVMCLLHNRSVTKRNQKRGKCNIKKIHKSALQPSVTKYMARISSFCQLCKSDPDVIFMYV